MGWTRKSAAVSVLLAMEEHRRQAGLRVVQLRESKGWGQEDLAHHANVSVKTVSRFENGRHEGRRTTVRQIAQALGVDETDIVGEPPAPLGLGAEPPADDVSGRLDRLEAMVGEIHQLVRETNAAVIQQHEDGEDLRDALERLERAVAQELADDEPPQEAAG